MKVVVKITKQFQSASKVLIKRYPSFLKDLSLLEKDLLKNPKMGTSLGNGTYKIRLKISSKGRGKSGEARLISLLETSFITEVLKTEDEITVNLLYVYDKSDMETLTDRELKDLIAAFYSTRK
jgi:mRNA-degrading endonuclease RelE of RelBE toxin-antitoxin system